MSLDSSVKGSRALEVVHAAEDAIIGVRQVPCDLIHPTSVRLMCDPGDLHRAGLELHDEEHDVPDQSGHGQHFDVKKPAAASPSQCAAGNVFQGVFVRRSGAGSMPWFFRMDVNTVGG
jgi:hypothetical protein